MGFMLWNAENNINFHKRPISKRIITNFPINSKITIFGSFSGQNIFLQKTWFCHTKHGMGPLTPH